MGDQSDQFPAELAAAVDALYCAVAAPETWADALHKIARASNFVGSLLYPRDQASTLLQLPVSPDLRELTDAYVQGGWFHTDPRAIHGWRAVDQGRKVITDADFMTPDERDRSPYFQDFHRFWKMPEWAAVPFKANGDSWCMTLLRDAGQGSVTDKEMPLLGALSSHLGRAVELATMLDRRQNARQIDILAQAGVAAALLDWKGTVTGLTAAAEALLGTEVVVRNGQFVVHHNAANNRVQAAVAAAGTGQPVPAEFVIVPREVLRPLIIQITALPAQLSDTFGRARLLLRFHDTEARIKVAGDVLRTAFGLTTAEIRLVTELGHEQSTDLIAEKYGISKETVRVQLKAAFRKTGTHKQSDLIALLAAMPRST